MQRASDSDASYSSSLCFLLSLMEDGPEGLLLAELRSTVRHHKSNDWYLLNVRFSRTRTFIAAYYLENSPAKSVLTTEQKKF
jgi:hypothetical protein